MNTLRSLIEAAGHSEVWAPVTKSADEISGSFSNPGPALLAAFGGGPTASGVYVDHDSVMQIAAAYACVRIISETVGSLPRHTFRRLEKGREKVRNHPVAQVMDRPNSWQSPMEFFEALTAHACLTGNGYAQVYRGTRGALSLEVIPPRKMKVERANDGGPRYLVTVKGGQQEVSRDDVIHVRGLALSDDMLTGLSPVTYHRETLGLAKVMDQYTARTFGKGLSMRAWIEEPKKLDPQIAAIRRHAFQEAYGGAMNAGGVAIMDNGSKIHAIDLSPKDKEFLLTRKLTIAEIARIWRVPLHKLGELDKATFSNIEHQSLEFVVDTIRPWLVRIEQAIRRTLFVEDSDFYMEHSVEGLLRGDIKSRYEAYATARNWGWMSADDVLELENKNPLPDGKGEEYLRPSNMTLAGTPV